jgi:hypothetical protein
MLAPRSARFVRWYYRRRMGEAAFPGKVMRRLLWRKVKYPQATYDPKTACWTYPLVLTDEFRVLLTGGMVGVVRLVEVGGEWTLAFQQLPVGPPQ